MNGLLRLQDYLTAHQYDGILLLSQTNLRYFAGFTGTTAIGFVTPNTAFIVTDSRYTEQAENQCEGYEVIQYTGSNWETIADIVKNHNITLSVCAFEGNYVPVDTYMTFSDIW